MPKYRVELQQTVYETATVEVEADDQEAAEQKAINIVTFSDVDDANKPIVWTPYDVQGAIEVTHSQEWPPVNDPDPSDNFVSGDSNAFDQHGG